MYSVFILEIKFTYIYIAFTISSTLSLILIYTVDKNKSFKKGFLQYFLYLIIIFIVVIISIFIFASKNSVYFDAFIS